MDQELALEIMLAGNSCFLTGAAGAGKTYTLNEFIAISKMLGKKVAVTASTGIAATHLNGTTIHSWSGIGIKHFVSRGFFEKMPESRKKTIRSADILIIDEISMLQGYFLDLVDKVCRTVREEPDLPFGGIQVILCGDFFQLPPVVRSEDKVEGENVFAYESEAWKNLDPVILYLNTQYRQEDDKFLEILNKIRDREITRADAEAIAARLNADLGESEITELHTTNRNVDRINEKKLAEVPGEMMEYDWYTTGAKTYLETFTKRCLAQEKLGLKLDTLVMAIKNDKKGRFANGSIGRVVGFAKPFNEPIVQFRNGNKVTVGEEVWEMMDGEIKRASITQIPLRPAYAITVHKSQGMTLDAARINLKNVFEPGMGYVALSRVKSLDSLSILGLHSNAFQVHPDVAIKDDEFKKQAKIAKIQFDDLRVNREKREKKLDKIKKQQIKKVKSMAEKPTSSWEERMAKRREKYPNAGMRWNKADDAELKLLFQNGNHNIKELCKKFGREPGSIRSRIKLHFGEDVIL